MTQRVCGWKSIVVLALAAAAGPLWAGGIAAITKPSEDVTLSFSRPGRIAEVLVKEGDKIAKNQAVVQQDDREERAQLVIDKAKAEDVTEIEAQKAVLEQKKVDYKRVQWAYDNGGVKSLFEVDSARLEVTINEARLKMAEFEHDQSKRKQNLSQVVVDKMVMRSPIEGVVEQTLVKTGESVEFQTKVIRIVNINPLWVEAPVPLAEARKLAKGASGKVTFGTDKAALEGKVVHIASVADAASDTLMVRLEVPNPALRQAGEQVTVEFTATVATKE